MVNPSLDKKTKSQLHLYTSRFLWDRLVQVLAFLRPRLPQSPVVLDFPAGSGKLAHFLTEELGAQVVAGDLDPGKWQYTKVPFQKADMAQPLPWGDSSFDLVVCLEGIKHSSNPMLTVAELARVLKPGGHMLITIPNDLDLQTRWRYVWDGFVDIDWKHPLVPGSSDDQAHLYPKCQLSLPFLYYLFERSGLGYQKSWASHWRKGSLLLYILFFPLIFLFTMKACRGVRHPLFKILLHPDWQCGKRNIIWLKKQHSVARNPNH